MEKHDLEIIEGQLSVIVGLLARLVLEVSLKPDALQKERVALLSSLGLNSGAVAQVLGTSGGSVRKAISRLRTPGE
jgi:DNA-directed RNA polymerase specialized sigma24 family protein